MELCCVSREGCWPFVPLVWRSLVGLNFEVSPAFRQEMKAYASEGNLSMVDLLRYSFKKKARNSELWPLNHFFFGTYRQ